MGNACAMVRIYLPLTQKWREKSYQVNAKRKERALSISMAVEMKNHNVMLGDKGNAS